MKKSEDQDEESYNNRVTNKQYQLGSVLSLIGTDSVFHSMVAKAPQTLSVKWEKQCITGAKNINVKYMEAI